MLTGLTSNFAYHILRRHILNQDTTIWQQIRTEFIDTQNRMWRAHLPNQGGWTHKTKSSVIKGNLCIPVVCPGYVPFIVIYFNILASQFKKLKSASICNLLT